MELGANSLSVFVAVSERTLVSVAVSLSVVERMRHSRNSRIGQKDSRKIRKSDIDACCNLIGQEVVIAGNSMTDCTPHVRWRSRE